MALSSLVKTTLQLTRQYSSCISVNDVYILSGMRTPIGCFQGQFASLNAVQLATKALTGAIDQSGINKDDVKELIMGCYSSSGWGLLPAHQVAIFSGLSNTITSSIVGRGCSSGFKATMFASQVIKSNGQEVVAAVGVETATHIPFILKRKNMRLGNLCIHDSLSHDGFIDTFDLVHVIEFAEQVAKEYKYTREEQDDYAVASFSRGIAARDNQVFAAEIVPIVLKKSKDEEEVICTDEQLTRLNEKKLRELKPEVGKDGTITAGNVSGLHDGAAAVILASGNYVLKKNLSPLARIVSYADGSVDSRNFVLSPSVVIPKALVLANLTQDAISRWEISETFALTVLLNGKILKIDPAKMNINGGAISLGHPFGMTGVRLVAHLAHTLLPGELGCASICNAGGGGSAIIIEKM